MQLQSSCCIGFWCETWRTSNHSVSWPNKHLLNSCPVENNILAPAIGLSACLPFFLPGCVVKSRSLKDHILTLLGENIVFHNVGKWTQKCIFGPEWGGIKNVYCLTQSLGVISTAFMLPLLCIFKWLSSKLCVCVCVLTCMEYTENYKMCSNTVRARRDLSRHPEQHHLFFRRRNWNLEKWSDRRPSEVVCRS